MVGQKKARTVSGSARWAAGLLCWAAAAMPAAHAADAYPGHAVTFIVPSTPGTTGDLIARQLAPRLAKRWGVPVVVDNKVGAGGAIGVESVARAAPDGYTFLVANTAFTTLAALRPQLPYDPIKDFAAVDLVGKIPLALIVSNSVPARTVREFIDYVKTQPQGRLNYASPGVGSVHHLTMELFQQETGVRMTHVPYKGTSGVLNDLAAGEVQASFVVLQTATQLVQAGKMRMLAVVAAQRAPGFPNVPTLAELGIPNMGQETWTGVEAPAGTPAGVIGKVNADINALLKDAEVQAAFEKMGVTAASSTPEELDRFVRNEIKTWSSVVAEARIVAE